MDAVGDYVSRARDRVVLGPSRRTNALAARATAPVWRYGRDFTARVVREGDGETVVDLVGPGDARERAVLRLLTPRPGVNAALAFAAAIAMGAEPRAAAAGLSGITSLPRRLGQVGVRDGVLVFDDCGNKHPVSMREGLLALRRHFPEARLTAVVEPYGPFLAAFGHRFGRILALADRTVLLPPSVRTGYQEARPYDAGWVRAGGVEPVFVGGHAEAAETAMRGTRPGDVVAFFALENASKVMARMAMGERV